MSNTNIAVITGRLTKDVRCDMTTNNIEVARFTVACNRPKKPNQDKAEADFINCVAWRNTAKYLSQYTHKGDKVTVVGRIQTSNFQDKNGNDCSSTSVVADRIECVARVENKQQTAIDDISEGFDTGEPTVTADDLPW